MSVLRGLVILALCGLWACDDGDGEGGTVVVDATTGAGGEGGAGAAGGAGGGAAGMGGAGGEVVESELQSLTVSPIDELLAGEGIQFELIGTYADGTTRDLSAEAEWGSSNNDIISFGDGGAAEVPHGGDVTITAAIGDLSAEWSTTVGCNYGRFAANIRYGRTVAPVQWSEAYREGNEAGTFDLRTASCHVDFKDITAFIMIVNAEWCAPCIAEIRRLGPEAPELLEQGGLIMYITIQNLNYGPITATAANRHINRLIGADSPGLRVGSVGTLPEDFFDNPSIIQAFPTAFVVRKSDMQVIADSRNLQYHIDPYLPAILADLDADWGDPQATAPLPFDSNCEEGDEEPGEPNDEPGQATLLEAGVPYEGGICAAAPDFYRIEEAGPWRFSIDFSHATGDVDIAYWAGDRPSNQPGQSSVSSDDGEVLDGTGPQTIVVYGYAGASAPYTITLEAR